MNFRAHLGKNPVLGTSWAGRIGKALKGKGTAGGAASLELLHLCWSRRAPGQSGSQEIHWIYLCSCHLFMANGYGFPLMENPHLFYHKTFIYI